MSNDRIVGAVMLAVAIGYYALAAAIPESMLADAVGPQGLPKVYAYILGALSLALMLGSGIRDAGSGIRKRAGAEPRIPGPGSRLPLLRVAGMLLIGVLYIAAVPWLGYLLSIGALILVTTYYQGGVMNRQVALVAASGAIVLWLLFVVLLGIPQPSGAWTSLF